MGLNEKFDGMVDEMVKVGRMEMEEYKNEELNREFRDEEMRAGCMGDEMNERYIRDMRKMDKELEMKYVEWCENEDEGKEKEMANVKWMGKDVLWMVYVWVNKVKVEKGRGSMERCVRYCKKVKGAKMVRVMI